MSTLVSTEDSLLARDVVTHLGEQLVAARRLLQIVLAQGAAIRERDVQTVVSLTGVLQAELGHRQLLEDRAHDAAGARRRAPWRRAGCCDAERCSRV